LLVLLLSQASTVQFASSSRIRGKRLLDLADAHQLYGRQQETTNLIVVTDETTRTADGGTTVITRTKTAATTTVTSTPVGDYYC
jgi:hypothetical protein